MCSYGLQSDIVILKIANNAGYIFTTLNWTSLCKKPAITEESIVQEIMDSLINSSSLLGISSERIMTYIASRSTLAYRKYDGLSVFYLYFWYSIKDTAIITFSHQLFVLPTPFKSFHFQR